MMTPLGQPASELQRRRSHRAKVFLSAVLECPGRELPVVLRNLSEHGALVEGKGITNDCEIHLRRKDLNVGGRVAWADGNRAGIAFSRCLSPEMVMEHVTRPAARPIAEPMHRRPAVSQRGMSLEEKRWFDEMSRQPK